MVKMGYHLKKMRIAGYLVGNCRIYGKAIPGVYEGWATMVLVDEILKGI